MTIFKFVFSGKYCPNKPLVFSFNPRPQKPIMLVKSGDLGRQEKILVAVNAQSEYGEHKSLNQRALDEGEKLAQHYDAESHVVNTYQDSVNYPDKGKLVRKALVGSAHIYVKNGSQESMISDIVYIVLIDTMAKKSVSIQ